MGNDIDIDIDMTGWTDEQREEYRVDELCGPLFAMFLDFMKAFADKAIDELDVSDEDADKMAGMLRDEEAGGMGAAYAYLLRHVKTERGARKMHHMVDAIWAARGRPVQIRMCDVRAEYDKLNKGDA